MKKIIKANLRKLSFLKNYKKDFEIGGVEEVLFEVSQDEYDNLEAVLEKNGVATKDGVLIADMEALVRDFFIGGIE